MSQFFGVTNHGELSLSYCKLCTGKRPMIKSFEKSLEILTGFDAFLLRSKMSLQTLVSQIFQKKKEKKKTKHLHSCHMICYGAIKQQGESVRS